MAHANHRRFVNLFTTPGSVVGGIVEPIEIEESVETIGETLVIGTPEFCIDKLLEYRELGIDHLMIRKHFGPDPCRHHGLAGSASPSPSCHTSASSRRIRNIRAKSPPHEVNRRR